MSNELKKILDTLFSRRARENIEKARGTAEVEMLCNLLRRKDLVIFVGSGISAFSPSGLPTGNQLRNIMLESLAKRTSILGTDIEKIKNENPSLELLCQIINDLVGDEFFDSLSLLNVDRPNSNHILLAKLAKLNLIRTIITTNFDCLIEEALMKEEKLKQDSDFFVYYNEDGFRRYLHEQKERSTSIIKLHGTIREKKSIIVSLRQIRGGLSKSQSEILEIIFKKNHVLFVGYSGNDLDIYTKFLRMAKNAKGIYWNLRPKSEISRGIRKLLSLYKVTNPIVMDLRKLFGQIAKGLNLYYPYPELTIEKSQQYLIESFDKWTSKMKISQPILILGFLSFYFYLHDVAINCFQQIIGMEAENKDKDKPLLRVALNNLGIIYDFEEKFDKAIDCFTSNLNFYKKIGNSCNLASSYNSLGEVFTEKGMKYRRNFQWRKAKAEFEKATECHEMALEIYKKIGDNTGLLATYSMISDLYYKGMLKLGKSWKFGLERMHLSKRPEVTKLVEDSLEYGKIPFRTYWYLTPNLGGYVRWQWDEFIKFYKNATESSKISKTIQQNWTNEKASRFVSNKEFARKKDSPEHRKLIPRRDLINMIEAMVIAIIGIIIVVIHYNKTASWLGSWKYIICWGAIVYGIIYFFFFLIAWLVIWVKYRRYRR